MITTSMASNPLSGRWTRAERVRLGGIVLAIAALHVAGWSMHLYWNGNLVAAFASVYLAGLVADRVDVGWLSVYAGLEAGA